MKKGLALALCLVFLASCAAIKENLSPAGSASPAPSANETHPQITTDNGYPQPSLTVYPNSTVYDDSTGNYLFAYFKGSQEDFDKITYWGDTDTSSLIKRQGPITSGYDTFASDGIFAATWHKDGTIYVATSTEESNEWKTASFAFPVEVEDDNIFISSFGFTTPQDGWLVANPFTTLTIDSPSYMEANPQKYHYLFTTSNGGATWNLVSSFKARYSDGIVFASPTVGWLTCSPLDGESNDEYDYTQVLYETNDGGKSWQPADVANVYSLLSGEVNADFEKVEWKNNRWQVRVIARNGWLASGNYIFSPEENSTTWAWNQPNWNMPEQDKGYFAAYINCKLLYHDFNGIETLQKKGFDHFELAFMRIYYLQYAPEVLIETTNEEGWSIYIIPPKAISEMAYYLYGIENFDVNTLPKENYDPEKGGIEIDIECAHGGPYNSTFVYAVETLANGDIEMIADHVFGTEGPSPRIEPDFKEQFQRYTFRPVTTKEGVLVYSMLSSETIEYTPENKDDYY